MSQIRGLVARIPVPRASDERDKRDASNRPQTSDGRPAIPVEAPLTEPDRFIDLTPEAGIYTADRELERLSIEKKIGLIETLIKRIEQTSPNEKDEGDAMRDQLSSVMKTLRSPPEFDRVFHSVDARSLLTYAPDAKRIRAQFKTNLRNTTPGDWEAYSKYLDNVTGTVPTTGNSIELLSDGKEAMERLTDDVRNAKRTIDLSMYKWEPDSVGLAFAAELSAKANPADPSQPRVKVRVMVDRQGSFDKDSQGTQRMLDEMTRNGVEVIVKETNFTRDNLDHRKVAIFDGTVGYAGGMNIGEVYRDVWRDQLSRLEGPIVNQLNHSMRTRWSAEGGALREDDAQPFQAAMPGPAESRVISHTGRFDDSFIKAAYLKAIYTAQRSINVSNPYFTDPDITEALCDAAKRGVRVRVVLPAVNDVTLLRDAARAGYPKLIKAGVEVYEYQGRMAHQKVATIDGTWSTFGSSNLDARSFDYNYELNVVSTDPSVAKDIDDELIEHDLAEGRSVRIESYKPNLKEKFFRAFSGFL